MDRTRTERKQCDESKCLSTGLMPVDGSGDGDGEAAIGSNPLLFNCYAQGPGTMYPYICADDYIGVRISNQDVSTSKQPNLHYFTCCPPDENDNSDSDNDKVVPLTRECEDPKEADPAESSSIDWNPSSTCQRQSPSFPYGRETTQIPGVPKAYMCCSVNASEEETEGAADTTSMAQSGTEFPTGNTGGEGDTTNLPPTNSSGVAMEIGEGNDNDSLAAVDSNDAIFVDSIENTPTTGQLLAKSTDGEFQGNPEGENSSSSNIFDEPENSCYSFPCQSCTVESNFLNLQTMNCYHDVYQYPQILETSGNTASYQCCSEPQGADSPFVLTSPAYRATVWSQFTLAFIAATMASLLIISIGRSLFMVNSNSSTTSTSPHRNSFTEPDYSAYNIYLILLAIPDLAYNLFMLGIVTDSFSNGWIPENDALITISATTYQYMSAIIAREVLVLLRKTKDGQHYVPPSFKKAGIQFFAVTVYATILGVLWLNLLHSSKSARATVAIPFEALSLTIFYLLVVILPTVYLLWVCFEIWRNKLLSKDEVKIDGTLGNSTAPTDTIGQSQLSLENFIKNSSILTTSLGPNDPRDMTNGTEQDTGSSNVADSQATSTYGYEVVMTTNTMTLDDTNATKNSSNGISNQYRTAQTPIAGPDGRLNELAIHFLRIILVFFFLWFPGMIMYYHGYQTDRNASGLLHNLGLIFFSLQAIVSNGMVFTKPDVKKSTYELCEEVERFSNHCYGYCCRCLQQKERGNESGTRVTDGVTPGVTPQSTAKFAEKWPEEDIEVPIHEEPSEMRSEASTKSSNRVVTVQHEIATIGGIQVSQLTTHTISSFNSSSHEGRKVGDYDTESNTENNESLEFALSSPRTTRKSRLSGQWKIAFTHEEEDSKSETTQKAKQKVSEENESGSFSAGSMKKIKQFRGERQNSDSLAAMSPASSKKKMNRRSSGSHLPEPHSAPPRRKSHRKSPIGHTMKRRDSGSHRSPSGSPIGQSRKSISSKRSTSGRRSISGKDTSGRRSISGKGTSGRRSISGKDVHAKLLVGPPKPRRPSGSHTQRRGSGSHVQPRRSSGSHVPVSNSPVAELRKKFNSDGNGNEVNTTSPVAQPAQRRDSDKVNASISTSPVLEMKKKFNANGNFSFNGDGSGNVNANANTSPVEKPAQRRGSGSHIYKVNASNSSVSEMRRKFNSSKNYADKSLVARPMQRRSSGSHLCKLNASNSPALQLVNGSSTSNLPAAPPKQRRNSTVGKSSVAELKKKFIGKDGQGNNSQTLPPKMKNSGISSSNASKSSGEPPNTLSISDKNVGETPSELPKRKNSGTSSSNGSKSPGDSRRRLSSSEKNFGESLFGQRQKKRNSGTISSHATKSTGHSRSGRATPSTGHSRSNLSGSDSDIAVIANASFGQLKNTISGINQSSSAQSAETAVINNVGDSSTPMKVNKQRKRRSKRMSQTKSLSFDGMVNEH